MIELKEPIGRTSYSNGEHFLFYDNDSFLEEIKEEIEYRPTSGFRYNVLSDDPKLRKDVDDIVYNLVGEENPNDLSYYENTREEYSLERGALRLAVMIDDLSNEIDPYEYWNNVENSEEHIKNISHELLYDKSQAEKIKEWFNGIENCTEEQSLKIEILTSKMDAFVAKAELKQNEIYKECLVRVDDERLLYAARYVMTNSLLFRDKINEAQILDIRRAISTDENERGLRPKDKCIYLSGRKDFVNKTMKDIEGFSHVIPIESYKEYLKTNTSDNSFLKKQSITSFLKSRVEDMERDEI